METETQEDTKDNSLTHVERLEKVAQDLKEQNERAEKLQLQQREAAALNELGGKTSAEPQKEVSEAEIKNKQAAEFFKGSELEEAIKKYNE